MRAMPNKKGRQMPKIYEKGNAQKVTNKTLNHWGKTTKSKEKGGEHNDTRDQWKHYFYVIEGTL